MTYILRICQGPVGIPLIFWAREASPGAVSIIVRPSCATCPAPLTR